MSQSFLARRPATTIAGTLSIRAQGFLLSLAIGVVLWELAAWVTGGVGFAHSWQTLRALYGLVAESEFWRAIAETIGIALLGLTLGLFLALLAGALLGSSPVIDRSTRATLNFAR